MAVKGDINNSIIAINIITANNIGESVLAHKLNVIPLTTRV